MMVVSADDSNLIGDPSYDEDTPSRRFLLPQLPILPVEPPRLSAAVMNLIVEAGDHSAPEADGDQHDHSMLFGRYMGQISARVERAWMRPRSVPTDGFFSCRVQITQDRSGNVQEVTLQKCTDDPQWRVSLVRAIGSASPLPAPPDPAAFSHILTMEFDSDPYVPGASDDGFEPPPSRTVIATIPASSSPRTVGAVTRRMRADGSVDLTITGPPTRGGFQQ